MPHKKDWEGILVGILSGETTVISRSDTEKLLKKLGFKEYKANAIGGRRTNSAHDRGAIIFVHALLGERYISLNKTGVVNDEALRRVGSAIRDLLNITPEARQKLSNNASTEVLGNSGFEAGV